MKKLPQFLDYFLQDCLWWDCDFSLRSMFWAYWIYKNLKIFAIYAYDELYFKVWKNNIKDYEKYNSKQFWYEKNWKIVYLPYYTLPEEILENREKLNIWIEKSTEVKK